MTSIVKFQSKSRTFSQILVKSDFHQTITIQSRDFSLLQSVRGGDWAKKTKTRAAGTWFWPTRCRWTGFWVVGTSGWHCGCSCFVAMLLLLHARSAPAIAHPPLFTSPPIHLCSCLLSFAFPCPPFPCHRSSHCVLIGSILPVSNCEKPNIHQIRIYLRHNVVSD